MAINMSKSIKEERLRWVLPIVNKQIKLVDATKVCPYSKRSLERWLAAFKEGGGDALEPKSTRPMTSPHETPIRIKEEVISLRKKTGLCSLKLNWEFEDKGLLIPTRTIGKILNQEGLTRKYRIKKVKYKYIKAELKAGELMEIDVKHVPGPIENRKYYQYTAIDCASRWRHLEAYSEETTFHSMKFLETVIKRFPHKIKAIKTDNGSIFTNYYLGSNKRSDQTVKTIHALDRLCGKLGIKHYLIDPGKPAQNGKVERSHREDQEKFYEKNTFRDFKDLKKKLRKWNIQYNDIKHCGLNGKTPNQYLKEELINPPNVLA